MLKLLKQMRQSDVTSDAVTEDIVTNNVSANQVSPSMQPIRILWSTMSQPIRPHLQCSQSGYCYQKCLSQSDLTSNAADQDIVTNNVWADQVSPPMQVLKSSQPIVQMWNFLYPRPTEPFSISLQESKASISGKTIRKRGQSIDWLIDWLDWLINWLIKWLDK